MPHASLRPLCSQLGCALLVLSGSAGRGSAQTVAPAWQATFDSLLHFEDAATAIALGPSGHVAVAGTTQHEPLQGIRLPQFLTVLYSAQGVEQWTRAYGSGFQNNGVAQKIAFTPAGKIVTAGTRDDGTDWMVVQYDLAGTLEWAAFWLAGSTYPSHLEDLDIDAAGNVYLCGNVSSGAGVAKFTSQGALSWSRVYMGSGQEIGWVRALEINASGQVFLAGSTPNLSGGGQCSVARIDPGTGDAQWIRNSGPAGAGLYSSWDKLGLDGLGRPVAGGLVNSFPGLGTHFSFLAYAPDGTLVWQYDHSDVPGVAAVIEDLVVGPTGTVVAVGWEMTQMSNVDGFALRLDQGTLAWERHYVGAAGAEDRATAVALDAQGNAYVGAFVQDVEIGYDVFVHGPAGNLMGRCHATPPPQGWGYARDVVVGPNARVYVTGEVLTVPPSGSDAVTAAFDLDTGLGSAFCLGDGTGTACPCGNPGGSGSGCANSVAAFGAALARAGNAGASNASDTLVLTAFGLPGPGLFFQGSSLMGGGIGTPFGDGLLCILAGLIRLGVVFPTNGSASYPGGLAPIPIHVAGTVSAGDVRHYQVWYRDSAAFCTSQTFNTTQGWTLTWGP